MAEPEVEPNIDPAQYEEYAKKIEEMAAKIRDMSPEEQDEWFKEMGVNVQMVEQAGGGLMDYLPFLICFLIILVVFVFVCPSFSKSALVKMSSGMPNFDPDNVHGLSDPDEFYRRYMGLTDKLEELAERIRQMPIEEQERIFREYNELMEGHLNPTAAPAFDPMNYIFYVPFLFCLFMLLLLFVFFGYKLYKSLTDKERKRDEKRKQRQMKKKK